MITKLLDSRKANFKGKRLEYGIAQTTVFDEINLGPRFTQEFIKRTAGTYAETIFAEFFNGQTEFEAKGTASGSSDVFDSNGNGWEIKSRNFTVLCATVPFCSSADNAFHKRSETDNMEVIKKKCESCTGIVVVDHQLLAEDGTCRFWKIYSQQVMSLFGEGLWQGERKQDGTKRKIDQTIRAKTSKIFTSTMAALFDREFPVELAA